MANLLRNADIRRLSVYPKLQKQGYQLCSFLFNQCAYGYGATKVDGLTTITVEPASKGKWRVWAHHASTNNVVHRNTDSRGIMATITEASVMCNPLIHA